MRIGLMLPIADGDVPSGTPDWQTIKTFAVGAEEAGLDSLWTCDHFVAESPERPDEIIGIHEGWTLLAALAAITSRVELGQLVMCMSFRDPALLAKMAVTADEISGGRVTLGVGAGWFDREYRMFGFPTDHRVSRFEEAMQIVRPLVRGERVTFAGRWFACDDARIVPAPARDIPVLIAARRPRMLRLAARYADAWNIAWFTSGDDRLRGILAELDDALRAESRDASTMRRTVGMFVGKKTEPKRDELARALDTFAAAGVDDTIVLFESTTERALEELGAAVRARA